MFDIDMEDTPASTIASLRSKNIIVICYMSAGTSENWRSDYSSFPVAVKGSGVSGWQGENWLDIRALNTLTPIMGARMSRAKTKGCDGVEPDNVDGYSNASGFPLTASDQLAYNRMLANEAHKRGMSAGLKNDAGQISSLVDNFDWLLKNLNLGATPRTACRND